MPTIENPSNQNFKRACKILHAVWIVIVLESVLVYNSCKTWLFSMHNFCPVTSVLKCKMKTPKLHAWSFVLTKAIRLIGKFWCHLGLGLMARLLSLLHASPVETWRVVSCRFPQGCGVVVVLEILKVMYLFPGKDLVPIGTSNLSLTVLILTTILANILK